MVVTATVTDRERLPDAVAAIEETSGTARVLLRRIPAAGTRPAQAQHGPLRNQGRPLMALKDLLTSMTVKPVKKAKAAPKDKAQKQPREAGPGARGWSGVGVRSAEDRPGRTGLVVEPALLCHGRREGHKLTQHFSVGSRVPGQSRMPTSIPRPRTFSLRTSSRPHWAICRSRRSACG